MARWTIETPERVTIDEPVTRLEVRLIAGRLNVVGTDGPARVEVNSIGREAVIVEHRDGVLTVRHDDPRNWPGLLRWLAAPTRRYRADVSIAVPHATAAALRMIKGSLVASALHGSTRLDVTSGRLTLLGLTGDVRAKTMSGPIEALGVGGDIHMETVSGEIVLADATPRRLYARAVSGSVTCDLDNPYGSDIVLDTTSGEIIVRVREDSDLRVHLRATSGRVTSAFAELDTGRSGSTHQVSGTLGSGSGQLTAGAVSGNVSLLRRPVEAEETGTAGTAEDGAAR